MTIFLGNHGRIELKRTYSDTTYSSIVDPADVNPGKNRFSFDFPTGMFVTGDRIEITATDGGLLTFVAASGWSNTTQQNNGSWYAFVDEIGGIKLYDTFANSLNGEAAGQIDLVTPDRSIPIRARIADGAMRILGEIESFELNNAREAVDVTALSDDFRRQQSSLITGSGSIQCLFNYKSRTDPITQRPEELSVYLHQLILRQKLGSQFKAQLYVVTPGCDPNPASNDYLWFELDGLITNAGVALSPGTVISSRFDFISTGPIKLKAITQTAGLLLQESSDYLLLEQGQNGRLELDYPD